jgi:hypothetical protein
MITKLLTVVTLGCVVGGGSLLIGGCVKYVDVPVWVCPAPTLPVREELKTMKLTTEADTDTILRSLIYDTTSLKLYADQLETILRGYARKPEDMSKFK